MSNPVEFVDGGMTGELKPCPFCGGKAYIVEGSDFGFFAGCSKCWNYTEYFKTKDEALKAWNARPIEDKLHEEIEKLGAENTRLREALQMIATEKDNHEQWLSVEQAAQIAKDTLETAEKTY